MLWPAWDHFRDRFWDHFVEFGGWFVSLERSVWVALGQVWETQS
ncbi:hypothetical protein [Lentibacter sp.]